MKSIFYDFEVPKADRQKISQMKALLLRLFDAS